LTLLVLLAAACEKKETTEAKPTDAPKTAPAQVKEAPKTAEDTIVIGEVGSLTGSEAVFGVSTSHGIDLAIDEANAQGGVKGKKLSVKVYDDQSKPEEAGSATVRLITQDKVKLILGEVASSNSLAMAPKAQEAKVPMITPSSTNPSVTEVGDYIFRVCFIDAFQGYVMARYAREDLKLNTAAILKDVKSAYSVGLTDVFERKFTEMGGKVVGIESYSKDDTDFRAQLTTIKKLKPQALYIPGYYEQVGKIASQAEELGLKTSMLGGDGWDGPPLVEQGGKAVEGAYFSDHFTADDPSPIVQNFIKKYQEKFKAVPDSMAALGYDAARVGIEAMKRAPSLEGPALREAIAQTKDFPGVAGTVTLNDKRDAEKPAVIVQVREGKFKYVATAKP
jgi:branched-chain amino acid transport system substrate-binding protein